MVNADKAGYLGYWKPGNFILRCRLTHDLNTAFLLVNCRTCGVATVLARADGLHTLRCSRCYYPVFGTSKHAIAFEGLLRVDLTDLEALQAALDDPAAL